MYSTKKVLVVSFFLRFHRDCSPTDISKIFLLILGLQRIIFSSQQRLPLSLQQNLQELDSIARDRGQSLAQMALSWVLHNPTVTSALIGASRLEQITDCIKAVEKEQFDEEELKAIDTIVGKIQQQ